METWKSLIVTFIGGLVFSVVIVAQDQSGFISIDCGGPQGIDYSETTTTGINYTSDASYINTGVSRTIKNELQSVYQRQLWHLRSFPDGVRNCYKINISSGSKYLIAAYFLYGNYDGLNKLPQFDILLGPNQWDTVNIHNGSAPQYTEMIHVPSLNYLQICLVNTRSGTPFISSLEFRTLKYDLYASVFGSLLTYSRIDLGSNQAYRYPYDVYDRGWYVYGENNNWTQLSVPVNNSINQGVFKVPAIVMSTAVTPVNANAPLVISWEPEDQTEQYYVFMHFMEIQDLPMNQTREFNVTLNGHPWFHHLVPLYHNTNTLRSRVGISGKQIKFSLEKTQNSTLPPIVNAIEIYKVIPFQQLDTFQSDVDAITSIKSVYGLTRDWQGDPCGPVAYLWDGLNCSFGASESPRITTLNLSSSGLSGTIDLSISKLTMLDKLDLSHNSLNGEIPDFLSRLQNLKILNLQNNNLTGSIPSALLEKSKKGSLSLSVGQNPYLCEAGECNDKKKNIITPVAASVGVLIFLAAIAVLLWIVKRRKLKALMVKKDQDETSLQQFKKQIYSYSDLLQITNNFSTTVGKGGFGTVYLGYIDEIPVAVKMLSPSSVHGYQQFQAEVKLLMRVHHRNLTSLVGYCNEGDNKALIYEYMANGNLHEHLSGKHSKSTILSWKDRLRITVDAALGLDYLHNGCKPPMIHRDVKSTNILLNEQFQAKLSDFGLSKIIPTDDGTHVSTDTVAGTPGYLDPECYKTNRLTVKSDVYSFGVVLLEITTGHPVVVAMNIEEHTHISDWVRSLVVKGDIKGIVDPRLEGDFDVNSAWRVVEIAMACVSPNLDERPIMSVIVTELKESLATEFARSKYSPPITMNMNTEITLFAR